MAELLFEIFTDEFSNVYIRPNTKSSFITEKYKSLEWLKTSHLFTSNKTFKEAIQWIDRNCLKPTNIQFPKNNISKEIKNQFKTEIKKLIS